MKKKTGKVAVANRFIRARCLKVMKRAQKELAKTQAEYDKFKEYSLGLAISK